MHANTNPGEKAIDFGAAPNASELTTREKHLERKLQRRIGALGRLLALTEPAPEPKYRRVTVSVGDNQKQKLDPKQLYERWLATQQHDGDSGEKDIVETVAGSVNSILAEIQQLQVQIDILKSMRLVLVRQEADPVLPGDNGPLIIRKPSSPESRSRPGKPSTGTSREVPSRRKGVSDGIMDLLIGSPGEWFSYADLAEALQPGDVSREGSRRVAQVFSNNLYQKGPSASGTFCRRLGDRWTLQVEEIRQIDPKTGKRIPHAKPSLRWRVVESSSDPQES